LFIGKDPAVGPRYKVPVRWWEKGKGEAVERNGRGRERGEKVVAFNREKGSRFVTNRKKGKKMSGVSNIERGEGGEKRKRPVRPDLQKKKKKKDHQTVKGGAESQQKRKRRVKENQTNNDFLLLVKKKRGGVIVQKKKGMGGIHRR